jgi:hypothetical protein
MGMGWETFRKKVTAAHTANEGGQLMAQEGA